MGSLQVLLRMTATVCKNVLWLKRGSTLWALNIIMRSCGATYTVLVAEPPPAIKITWLPLPTVSNQSPSSWFWHPHPHAPLHPHQLYFLCFWLILSHLRFWNYQWELFKSPRYEIAMRRLWKTLINPKWRGAHSKSRWILSVIEIWLVTVAVLNPSWR